MTSKECDWCGEQFDTVRPRQVNCSTKCRTLKKERVRFLNHKPERAYNVQKRRAKARGVGFSMSFDEWCWFWNGHWDKRGNKPDQLAMCRKGDKGVYEIGNIYLDTNRNNSKLAVELKPPNKCETTGRFI